MLKNSSFLLVLTVIIMAGLSSCEQDREGSLRIIIKGTYEDNPLVMFENQSWVDGMSIEFTRSDFYISDMNLVSNSNESVFLSEAELVDLSFTSNADAGKGYSMRYENIPSGKYQMLNFNIGIPQGLNQTVPEDYSSSHPLGQSSHYWKGWASYIFSKAEGNIDTLGNGEMSLGFAYHTGTDALLRTIVVNSEIHIPDGGESTITIFVDHKKLLFDDQGPINIKDHPQNHKPEDLENVMRIMDNFVDAMTISR